MIKSTVPPSHDQETRARIRNKLLHYMRAHRIGAPELTARIYDAQKIKQKAPVGISTVQRFLAGKVRTVESYVDMFDRFVEGLPCPDPIGLLGERLSVFYGVTNGRDYSGTYFTNTRVLDSAELEARGDSKIDIAADAGFWRVTEKTASGLDLVIYDGVLVCSGAAAVVVLKDRLAGLARNYMLWPENETLHGHGATMRFLPGDTTEVWGKFKISSIEPIEIRLIKAIV